MTHEGIPCDVSVPCDECGERNAVVKLITKDGKQISVCNHCYRNYTK